ncbi:hypothetical protein B8W95_13780, partial [Staphylococcus pasteuri]
EEEEEEDSDEGGGAGGGLGIKSAAGGADAESKDELAAYGAGVDLWSSGIVIYEVGPVHCG